MRLLKDYVNYKPKKYAQGGAIDYGALAAGVASTADTLDPGNAQGRQKVGTTTLKGAASGAALGTSILPGWGTAIGAVVGGAAGYIGGKTAKNKEGREQSRLREIYNRAQFDRSAAEVAANPESVTGYDFGATGGYYAKGGQLRPLSSTAVDVIGPSHAQGGVMIGPNEVEGDETIDKGYVFSEQLGFAEVHRPLAKAIGSVEKKPFTRANVNTLRRLNQRVESLKTAQEFIKSQYK